MDTMYAPTTLPDRDRIGADHDCWTLASRSAGNDRASSENGAASPGRVFHLDARFDHGGVWAGVETLTEIAYLDLVARGQDDIVERHGHELFMVLWQHRDRIHPRHMCLTDTSSGTERTRFYALDRAYRLVHGLVGLMLAWKRAAGDPSEWVVVVHGFDRAQHLGTRFFAELARRGAGRGFTVVVQAGPGWSDVDLRALGVVAEAASPAVARSAAWANPPDLSTQPSAGEDGPDALEHAHPKLLARYRQAGNHLEAARIGLEMLGLYARRGYHHEAKSFLDDALPYFEQLVSHDEGARVNHVSAMNSCLVMTDEPDKALHIVERLAAPYLTRAHCLANMNYMLAMHHLRYAEARNIELAERYMLRAIENMRAAVGSADARQQPFLEAFIGNGLAFLKVRQGRPPEAVELCRTGYDRLVRDLDDDQHKLHRSVLLYNIAQVHVMLGRLDDGLHHYRRAIAMDPHYSEYHNEVGNLLQRQERYDEAAESYARAVACSPPYPEVLFNKAVCHTRQQRWEEALACFADSLELLPDQPEVFALRAELFEQLGQADDALTEYDRAIEAGFDTVAARVNRAVLHYDNGAFGLALLDMDHVIARESGEAAHYENRAAIHDAMQNEDRRREDLAAAERCRERAAA